ncbi:heat-inducible transcription repressor HrcA [Halioglobus japonicus]|uniref:Heat-inducible transcription repressor HrcA n=1 Tax=Halioglobus japonicus TaxID=930805 RepID=A0AAP8MED4_9GAMM|nr:heat-inducible transcriptional repressor HrcA [Halioglobus japonicus]AQA18234.1 heat-inducible transcription repressor HrcA [Halioglobus japonicus]PLW86240.1 heat-inducible transcription repressor HrcA [Halioglobus japonicus]GHD13761.1 heat-inducible transcription repressor HrcA [Halioglobus japonicus]
MSIEVISDRASVLLKTLVERHIRDGQPVGSRTLMEESGLPVSAATIRNVMSDLEDRGFLVSPHTSAGRIPTAAGYRLFVDSLLQVQPLTADAVSALRTELNPDKTSSELVQSASNMLANITAQAGLVTVPKQEANQLRQVEFLPLSGNRVLAILVVNEREVQNRIIHTERPFSEEQLREAAAMVNQRFAGQALNRVQDGLLREMHDARAQIDAYLRDSLDLASKALGQEDNEEYVVAGESTLIGNATAEEVVKLRELFDAFEQKKDLLHLLDRCSSAEGVQVFIGEEAGYEVFGDYSVVTAPYSDGVQTLGVLGVIGPTRMAYERVIPIVDVTAKMLSQALAK